MTVRELIYQYKRHNKNGHFFDSKTIRFFGDDLETATVEEVTAMTNIGPKRCWKYTANQDNAPVQPYLKTTYFDVENYHEYIDAQEVAI